MIIFKIVHNLKTYLLALIVLAYLYEVGVSPVDLGEYMAAKASLAYTSTSMTATITPNPSNTLAAQLQEKEAMLKKKEAELAQKEAALNNVGNIWQNKSFLILFLMIFALLFLIVANFFLDFKRQRHTVLRA